MRIRATQRKGGPSGVKEGREGVSQIIYRVSKAIWPSARSGYAPGQSPANLKTEVVSLVNASGCNLATQLSSFFLKHNNPVILSKQADIAPDYRSACTITIKPKTVIALY
jgi:hypothetical protein